MEQFYIAGIIILALLGYWYVRKRWNGGDEDEETRIAREIATYTPLGQKEMAALSDMERLVEQVKGTAVKLNQHAIYKAEAAGVWRISQEGSRPLMVMVMGEFKTGKSTFINTILGEEILTADVAPATAVTSLLCFGETKRLWLHYADGRKEEYPFEKLAEITAEGDESKRTIRESLAYVEIALPNEMLKRVNLIDTPGLNVHRESHIRNTENFKDKADVVLWVFNAARSATRTEIQEIKALGSRLKPFAVVNRIDNIDEEEESVEAVLDKIEKRLSGVVQGVFGLSSKLAREAVQNDDAALLKQSGWADFMEKLEQHFLICADELKMTALSDKVQEFLNQFRLRLEELGKTAAAKEKNFGSRDEALQNIKNFFDALDSMRKEGIESQDRIECGAKLFCEKLENNRGKVELIDDTKLCCEVSGALVGAIEPVLPIIGILEKLGQEQDGFKEATTIAGDLSMMNDEIDAEVARLHGWNDGLCSLNGECQDLDNEKAAVDELGEEYRHSGVFGGEPVFDFSGRRERFNNSVEAYNTHLKQFGDKVQRHWGQFIDICADIFTKNKDIQEVLKKMNAFLERKQQECLNEQARFERDFEQEKREQQKLCDEIKAGQCILQELVGSLQAGMQKEAV